MSVSTPIAQMQAAMSGLQSSGPSVQSLADPTRRAEAAWAAYYGVSEVAALASSIGDVRAQCSLSIGVLNDQQVVVPLSDQTTDNGLDVQALEILAGEGVDAASAAEIGRVGGAFLRGLADMSGSRRGLLARLYTIRNVCGDPVLIRTRRRCPPT